MSSDPEAGRKLREAVERYATREGVTRRTPSVLDAVLYCFVPDDQAVEALQSLLIDLVFRYLFAAASARFDESGRLDAQFERLLDDFLARYTRLTDQNRDNFRRILKQAVLTSHAPRPKSEVRDRYLQKRRRYRCYLCGEDVSEEDERLDHVWPCSAGGGTGQSNLWRSHTPCQAVKQDLAVPADAPLGRFAFGGPLPRYLTSGPDPWWERTITTEQEFVTFLDDVRAAVCRVALVIRQRGRCAECATEFRSTNGTNLRRLESDLPWWLPNTVVVCDRCAEGG